MKISQAEPPMAAGRLSGPDEAPEGPRGRRGMTRRSEHQPCTNTGQSGDPSDDYKPRAALVVTHFFWAKTDIPPK